MPMQQLTIIMGEKNNDLTEIIAQALNEMKSDLGDKFDLEKVNLAELERRTGCLLQNINIQVARLKRTMLHVQKGQSCIIDS